MDRGGQLCVSNILLYQSRGLDSFAFENSAPSHASAVYYVKILVYGIL